MIEEPKKRRGARKKHTGPVTELHLKFSGSLAEHIQRAARSQEYQKYFDELVRKDMLSCQCLSDEKIQRTI